jgi:hypothetical protein
MRLRNLKWDDDYPVFWGDIITSVLMKSPSWGYMPVIPALGRLRQEDPELEANLGYKARPCHKTTNKTKQTKRESLQGRPAEGSSLG